MSPAQTSFSDVVGEYGWLWTDEKLPVQGEELLPFVTVAIAANGNLTAGARRDWLPRAVRAGVTSLPGPPCSLYSFDATPDFSSWVESNARDWQAPRS